MIRQIFKPQGVFCSFLAMVFATSSLAEVSSMSIETSRNVGAEAVNQVSLRCGGDSNPRFIIKPSEKIAPWCSVKVKGMCDTSKYALARKVCKYNSKGFKKLAARSSQELDSLNAPNSIESSLVSDARKTPEEVSSNTDGEPETDLEVRISELQREQILIEEQRIQIEQRRLELVSREIALKKGILPVSGTGD